MPRLTIRERREQRKAATARANKFCHDYLRDNPKATDAQVQSACKADLETAGFDISTIGALLELIMQLIAMFRKK